LSISEEQAFPSLRFSPVVAVGFCRCSGSRVSISQ